ncbi:hypothetical protein AN958_02729 [Leucoagaricus sp. SymC.cos]|nr:hypothetical protein AN958_02729 [Leucoagaricus sp. SymC.cos]
MAIMDSSQVDVRFERAEFDGILIAILAYGALVMLFIQLLRVLLVRPKRGKVFWGITAYSSILFTLASMAAGGKIKFAEYIYVTSRINVALEGPSTDSWIPSQVFKDHAGSTMNIMSRVCTLLTPWIGDAFMIYRLMVIWSYKWWMLIIPVPLYISHVGMSIPVIIADTRLDQARWEPKSHRYGIVFHTLCVALNLLISLLITVKLLTMRKKLEIALGKLNAYFYTSKFTILVESGAFATLWGIVYLATLAQKHWSQAAFLQPYYYVIALTRMIIVLKMAQNQAWSRDIVSAASHGVMDWEVSSSHTISVEVPHTGNVENGLEQMKSPDSSVTSSHTLG